MTLSRPEQSTGGEPQENSDKFFHESPRKPAKLRAPTGGSEALEMEVTSSGRFRSEARCNPVVPGPHGDYHGHLTPAVRTESCCGSPDCHRQCSRHPRSECQTWLDR